MGISGVLLLRRFLLNEKLNTLAYGLFLGLLSADLHRKTMFFFFCNRGFSVRSNSLNKNAISLLILSIDIHS